MDIFEGVNIDEAVKAVIGEKIDAMVKGLKENNQALISEKQQVKADKEAAEAKSRAEAEEAAKAKNDYKQLFESQKAEADLLKSELETVRVTTKRQKIQTEAARMAASLTKDTGRAKLLEQQFSNRLDLVDGELKVLDDSGKLTVSSIEELVTRVRTEYPFLVDGSQSKGGGATRSDGRADLDAKEITRADFDSMSQLQRKEFSVKGGKVVD